MSFQIPLTMEYLSTLVTQTLVGAPWECEILGTSHVQIPAQSHRTSLYHSLFHDISSLFDVKTTCYILGIPSSASLT